MPGEMPIELDDQLQQMNHAGLTIHIALTTL
jgi:hypothetical protein